MPEIAVRGISLYYEEEGPRKVRPRGEPVLLIHGGLGTGRRHFRYQAVALAQRRRVLLPDLYGYGRSRRRTRFDPDFYFEDAAHLAELLRVLGIERVQVGGFSDGAIVALCLAMDFPELVNSLALIGASTYIDESNLAEIGKLAPPESLPAPLQAALARAHGEDYWRELVTIWVAGQWEILRQGGNINRERLPEVTCPLLLIHGGADEVIGTYHAEVIKDALPRAELVILPGRGHFVLQEAPEETTELLVRFFDRYPVP